MVIIPLLPQQKTEIRRLLTQEFFFPPLIGSAPEYYIPHWSRSYVILVYGSYVITNQIHTPGNRVSSKIE